MIIKVNDKRATTMKVIKVYVPTKFEREIVFAAHSSFTVRQWWPPLPRQTPL
jgi:hypothetical protein